MRNLFFSLVLLFSLLVSSSSSFAQALSLTEVKDLAKLLQNTSEVSELSCSSIQNLNVVQIFLFDGDLGFCPRYFLTQFPHSLADGTKQSFAERVAQTPITPENERDLQQIAQSLHDERLIKNCLLAKTAMNQLANKIQSEKTVFHYYSKRGEKEASLCAKQILEKTQLTGQTLHLRVVAYSMGSEAALRFAQSLLQNEIQIEKIETVDPVGRNINWTTGVITTEDNAIFKAPENVLEWINYFQKQDHYSLLHTSYAHLGIRGSRVIRAQLNHEFLATDFLSEEDRKHGHVHILSEPLVLQTMDNLFSERP